MKESLGIDAGAFSHASSDVAGQSTKLEGAEARDVRESLRLSDLSLDKRVENTFIRRLSDAESMRNESWMVRGCEQLDQRLDAQTEIVKVNPHYSEGRQWKTNCQRCVPTFEMRMRGYDVTAQPASIIEGPRSLRRFPFDVWRNPDVRHCEGNGKEEIEKAMRAWGDGSRAQVVVMWKGVPAGHTFVAEQVDGKTRFLDPQTGNMDVTSYFDRVDPGRTRFCRIDNLEVTDRIKQCCKEA